MPPNADDYPPHYEEVGGWRHLITDEPEWLARPSSWGIDKLPEPARVRKRELHDGYWFPRVFSQMAERLECGACRNLILGIYHDATFVTETSPHPSEDFCNNWYQALHPDLEPGERCKNWQTARQPRMYLRGVVTRREMLNTLLDHLYQLQFQWERQVAWRWRDRWQADRDWDRWISLELVGPNPFRPVVFDPEWRSHTAVALAEGMYAARDFGAMPVLADALEEAGCDSADVLGHCRGPGPHVRGCWVLDHVLGLV
jgi:hypothetical protein